jgi:hypothetical protein
MREWANIDENNYHKFDHGLDTSLLHVAIFLYIHVLKSVYFTLSFLPCSLLESGIGRIFAFGAIVYFGQYIFV